MSVFTNSISDWVHNISINSVIMMIMMIFMLVGAIDKIRGNKKGYGEKFEEGFNAIGPLAISMAGVVAAAPVLATILGPVIKPIYNLFGADCSQQHCLHVTWAVTRWQWSWQATMWQSVNSQD